MDLLSNNPLSAGALIRIRCESEEMALFGLIIEALNETAFCVVPFVPDNPDAFLLDTELTVELGLQGLALCLRESSILEAEDLLFMGRLDDEAYHQFLKEKALFYTRQFSRKAHHGFQQPIPQKESVTFVPGETPVPYSGRVFDEEEVVEAVSSCMDFWLTLGEKGKQFEASLASYLGVKRSLLTNSGSSANLLALSALTSHKLPVEKRLQAGDEVITCAAGFPTTVAPIVQNGAVPVFIDNDPITGNPDFSHLEEAFTPGKTKAVIFAHTLGNPFDLLTLKAFCEAKDIWLIEDNCDALGSRYRYQEGEETVDLLTGTVGDLSTQSFYPPHHLTMGEGGAVNIRDKMQLKTLVESFRDWGRDCWCSSGMDNTCHKRFSWQLGDLPKGYDHKYIYSHLGYNLKPLDIQAAIGQVQLEKLPAFIEARKHNWEYLRRGLGDLQEFFEFSLPTHARSWSLQEGFQWDESHEKSPRTIPSWFGFMLLVRPSAPFTKVAFTQALDRAKIGNRGLFGGNLVRQPVFTELKRTNPEAFRVVGALAGADRIMNECVFIGVYPGLSIKMLDYVIEVIHDFCREER